MRKLITIVLLATSINVLAEQSKEYQDAVAAGSGIPLSEHTEAATNIISNDNDSISANHVNWRPGTPVLPCNPRDEHCKGIEEPITVPEPNTIALLGLALVGLGARKAIKKNAEYKI